MDCREFQKKHVGFVDDFLPATEMDAMRRHRARCASCARRDTAVRRSLLLVHNLPEIEPSADFVARLNGRLASLAEEARDDFVAPHSMLSSVGVVTALAAGIAAIAFMSVETSRYFAPVAPVAAPAVAMLPMSPVDPVDPVESIDAGAVATPTVSNAAFVASASTGLAVWPAVLMLGQAPMRFATLMNASETEPSR